MDDTFFDATQWRACIQPEGTPLPIESIEVVLDTAFTSQESSDKSALVASCKRDRKDGIRELCVVDCRTQRWRGGALADAAIDFCVQWKATQLRIEKIPATDLLIDTILLKCEVRGIDPPSITAFTPNNAKGAKNSRICRLQSLFKMEPPALKLFYGPYLWPLLEEVENFVPSVGNRGRQVNSIDCLSLAAGFR